MQRFLIRVSDAMDRLDDSVLGDALGAVAVMAAPVLALFIFYGVFG